MSDSKILTLDDVSQQEGRVKGEYVHVEEWGGQVFLRSLPGSDVSAWLQKGVEFNNQKRGIELLEEDLVARALVDPDSGERWFSDNDLQRFGNKFEYSVITKLAHEVRRINGLEKRKEDHNDRVKKSGTTAGGVTGTG